MKPTPSDRKSTFLHRLNCRLMWVTDILVAFGCAFYFNVPENTAALWQAVGTVAEPVAVAVYSLPGVPRPGAAQSAAAMASASQPDTTTAVPTIARSAAPSTDAATASTDATPASADATQASSSAIPPAVQLVSHTPSASPPQVQTARDDSATEASESPRRQRRTHRRVRKGPGKPVLFAKRKLGGVPFYLATVDLTDPESFMVVGLANNATAANSETESHGHESFDSFVKRCPGAVVINGTFFSKDERERVMGNIVSEGKFLKYSRWENYGTTLAITEDNEPLMVTARSEGQPDWSEHWFSLTCGPRLVKDGEIWVVPEVEGFTDSHVLGVGPRSAIGYTKSKDKLYIVSFLCGLSLEQEAKIMKELGCVDAMNLDGGASKGLAVNGKTLIKPGRALTNVLVVYDHAHKAPKHVIESWTRFQEGDRPTPPDS